MRPNTSIENKLDLAFNNVKPKDWYFILDQTNAIERFNDLKHFNPEGKHRVNKEITII